MKKNTFLKFVCSLVLCLTVGFMFMGCDVNEIKDATTAGIEASTSIIPVEYSKDLATGTLISAFNNSLKKEGYKSKLVFYAYGNEGIIGATGSYYETICSVSADSISYQFKRNLEGEEKVYYYTCIGNKYYLFDDTAETYAIDPFYDRSNNDENKGDILATGEGLNQYTLAMYTAFISKVEYGKYYQGAEHIYASVKSSSINQYYDFEIRNGFITSINIVFDYNGTGPNHAHTFGSLVFEYGAQTIEDLPTSLEGYSNIDA